MKDSADKRKVMRIIETEQGHQMKRIFESGPVLKYKDVELADEDYLALNDLHDVPH